MLDYNTRRLIGWVLTEFRAPLLLCAGAALLAGYAFGCFRSAHVPANGLVSVFALNASPDKYNARAVCVRGKLLNLKDNTADPDLPYSVFSLKETRAAGDYDFINVISFAQREAPGDGLITACGIFNSVKQVGRDTYHNIIFLNAFREPGEAPAAVPISGAKKSRAF